MKEEAFSSAGDATDPAVFRTLRQPRASSSWRHKIWTNLVSLTVVFVLISRWIEYQTSHDPSQTVHLEKQFNEALNRCAALANDWPDDSHHLAIPRSSNARYDTANSKHEQPIRLHNATLFDGETFLPRPVDILVDKGLVVSVSETSSLDDPEDEAITLYDLKGAYVTPGKITCLHSIEFFFFFFLQN